MDDAWAKLAELEETFTGMLSKTYRLQSQRVCLEMLSGEPGDGHPDTVILFWITHPTEQLGALSKRDSIKNQK